MIYLYKNKTLNYGDNVHVFFDNVSAYVNYLGTPYMSFEENRYTLNGNTAEIQLFVAEDIDSVTYITWNNSGNWRFYFVRSAVYQSGYVIFTLEMDIWATYIAHSTMSNIRITRCNRNVGTGVYDTIPATVGREFVQLGNNISATDLAVVYVVAFATGQSSILVNNAGTSIGVFAQEMTEDDDKPTGVSLIDWWVDLVSGIYAATATIGDLDANVLKAYIVPKTTLGIKSGTVPIFKTKTASFNGTLTPSFEVAPFIFPVRFDIDIDPNYKYFVGTKHSGVELVRTTSATNVFYNYIVKQDGLQVIVQQGDRMLDITDAFQIGLTSNDGNFTATEKVARILQITGGIANGAFQIMQGGSGYVTGSLAIANALTNVVEQGNARYAQGGDGISTFRNLAGGVQSPYYIQRNQSINQEDINARMYGAVFNQYVSNLDTVFTSPLLGKGTFSETYFAAEIRLENVPTEAHDLIVGEIQRGVYAVKL